MISLAHLLPSIVRIHHAAHLSASVDHYACCFAIRQEAVPPKSVFQVEAFSHAWILSASFHLKDSLKVIDIQLRCFCLDCGQQPYQIGLIVVILQILMREPNSFPKFPICLTIQLIGPYEDCPVFLTSAENDNISRDALVALNFNDMAYFKIL